MNIDNVTNKLKQIEIILRTCGESRWLSVIESFIAQLLSHGEDDDFRGTLREIIGMYGGMGSFNDLVLFDGGKVCYSENEQLNTLREELYALCQAVLVSQ